MIQLGSLSSVGAIVGVEPGSGVALAVAVGVALAVGLGEAESVGDGVAPIEEFEGCPARSTGRNSSFDAA